MSHDHLQSSFAVQTMGRAHMIVKNNMLPMHNRSNNHFDGPIASEVAVLDDLDCQFPIIITVLSTAHQEYRRSLWHSQ